MKLEEILEEFGIQDEEVIGYVNDIYQSAGEEVASAAAKAVKFYEDPEIKKKITEVLRDAFKLVKDPEVVKFAAEAIEVYSKVPEIGREVAGWIRAVAERTKDPEVVKFVADMYLDEKIRKAIEAYSKNPGIGSGVALEIWRTARWTKDPEVVKFFADMYLDEKIRKAIEAYSKNPGIGKEVAGWIGSVAWWTKDPEVVKFVADMYLDEKIRKAIEAYSKNPGIGKEVAGWIGSVAWWTKDPEVVKLAAEAIEAYSKNPEIGGWVAGEIGSVAKDTKDPEVVKKVSEIFFDKKLTRKMLHRIETEELIKYIDYILKDKEDAIGRIIISKYTNLDPMDKNFYDKLENLIRSYGIEAKLSVGELVNFFESYKNLEGKNSFVKAINLISNGYWDDEKIREITKEIEKEGINVEGLKGGYWVRKVDGGEMKGIGVGYDELAESLLISLVGSRDQEKYERAYNVIKEIDGEEKLEKAKSLIKGNKDLRKKLIEAYKKGNPDEILEILENTGKGKKKGSYEALHDLVSYVRGKRDGVFEGNYIVGFYGKNVDAMFRNDTTMCCALLPDGANKYRAVLYQLDPRVVTIGYTFVDEIRKGKEMEAVRERGEIDGIVIGYIGKHEGEPILLIDSVEGGRRFRNYLKKNWEKVYDDINRVAKGIGAKYVLLFENLKFNYDNGKLEIIGTPFNETPREFLKLYINKKIGVNFDEKEEFVRYIKMNRIGRREIPYDYAGDGRQYLEAFDGWKIPEGKVRGYLYEV